MPFISRFAAIFSALLLIAMTNPAFAADDRASVLDRFSGIWTATGNSFGAEVKSRMVWSKALDGQFHRIDYDIIIDAEKAQRFSGIGHYKAVGDKTTGGHRTAGYWADNSGDLHPLSVTLEDDAIISIWGIAGKKMGRSEYRLITANRATVTDWLFTKTGWQQFNQAEFVRVPGK